MTRRGEVLVAIINKQLDFTILREHLWYRIPVSSVERWLGDHWPPKWLALYQTKAFGEEKHAIHYVGEVRRITEVPRSELFPDEPRDARSTRMYYRIRLSALERLARPIYSRRLRRIVFIASTWEKFCRATEVNDLFAGSSLEESLWDAFKARGVPAEREQFVVARGRDYALDFALYCAQGKIDVETDGDAWHANPQKAAQDNHRDHDLGIHGWSILRFAEKEIIERAADYCVGTVIEKANALGGFDEGNVIPRRIHLKPGPYQPSLFD